jgi:hypothetical protein
MTVDLDTQPTKIQTKVEIHNKKTRITHIGKPCELALRSAFAPSPSLLFRVLVVAVARRQHVMLPRLPMCSVLCPKPASPA